MEVNSRNTGKLSRFFEQDLPDGVSPSILYACSGDFNNP